MDAWPAWPARLPRPRPSRAPSPRGQRQPPCPQQSRPPSPSPRTCGRRLAIRNGLLPLLAGIRGGGIRSPSPLYAMRCAPFLSSDGGAEEEEGSGVAGWPMMQQEQSSSLGGRRGQRRGVAGGGRSERGSGGCEEGERSGWKWRKGVDSRNPQPAGLPLPMPACAATTALIQTGSEKGGGERARVHTQGPARARRTIEARAQAHPPAGEGGSPEPSASRAVVAGGSFSFLLPHPQLSARDRATTPQPASRQTRPSLPRALLSAGHHRGERACAPLGSSLGEDGMESRPMQSWALRAESPRNWGNKGGRGSNT